MGPLRTSTWISIAALAFGFLLLTRLSNAESSEERLERLWSAPYTPTKMEWLAVLLRADPSVSCEPLRVNVAGRRSLVIGVGGSATELEEHFWRCVPHILMSVQFNANVMNLPPPTVLVEPMISTAHARDLERKYRFHCTPKPFPKNWKDWTRQTLDTMCPDVKF